MGPDLHGTLAGLIVVALPAACMQSVTAAATHSPALILSTLRKYDSFIDAITIGPNTLLKQQQHTL